MSRDCREIPHNLQATSPPFVDESKDKLIKVVAAHVRVWDNSSLIQVPMTVNVFGYDNGSIC